MLVMCRHSAAHKHSGTFPTTTTFPSQPPPQKRKQWKRYRKIMFMCIWTHKINIYLLRWRKTKWSTTPPPTDDGGLYQKSTHESTLLPALAFASVCGLCCGAGTIFGKHRKVWGKSFQSARGSDSIKLPGHEIQFWQLKWNAALKRWPFNRYCMVTI